MHWWTWVLIAVGLALVLASARALSIRRSRTALIELAQLVPLCIALLRDLMRDPQMPRRAKIAPAFVLVYLAIPIDLIPDFIPGLGHLDDALVIASGIRHVVAAAGREHVAGHWRGDPDTLERMLRLARVHQATPPEPSS